MADSTPSSSSFSHAPSQYPQRPGLSQVGSSAETSAPTERYSAADNNFVPRPKRIACVVCRRRKLRCDGKRPSCGTCSRLGHECAYDEVRKKSGPKRGYVKQLEARLAQVETLLKGQESDIAQPTSPPQPPENAFTTLIRDESNFALPEISALGNGMEGSMPSSSDIVNTSQGGQSFFPPPPSMPNDTPWDLISLGLEEPLPTQEVIDELEQLFFEKIYPTLPIIHRPRYLAALNLAPHMRPPVCLRYIMWCHAAAISDKYYFLHSHFYQRARKYAGTDEMRGFGESIVSVAHCQAWILICTYEFRMIYFPRAWLGVGKAARLALMMGLNRLDGVGLDVKQAIPPPKDWTEREERRRVFWMCFCMDRYASIGTGWPMMIDEQDVMTNLPASEESFVKSKPQRTLRLVDIIAGEGVSTLSSFACVVVLSSLFGRNLVHVHRPHPQENDHDLNGEFWKRHRSHDNTLLHISLSLPDHLRLPTGMADVNVIFSNMSIHTSTICLHQAAIFKAEKNKMSNQIITESKRRCLVAANQISSIMKMISHVDLSMLNPFMSFCLYIAARVFVQYLKSRPDDSTVYSSLQFVITALNAMKMKNPLTESFLVQLDVDLEGTGIRGMEKSFKSNEKAAQAMQSLCNDSVECTPLFTLRQSQSSGPVVGGSQQESANSGIDQYSSQSGMTASLPSRHKGLGTLPIEVAASGVQQIDRAFVQPTPYSRDTASGMVVDMDLDLSPDFGPGEKNNPPSDHPTPSTMNSSNTSYSMLGTDITSPGKKQQKSNSAPNAQGSATSSDRNNSAHISPTGTEPSQVPDLNSFANQMYPSSTTSPLGTAEAASAFTMPSGWDFPTPNPEAGSIDLNNLPMEPLSEAQWAQLLNGTGTGTSNGSNWEPWRPT